MHMKDFLKQYKQQKYLSFLGLIAMSLVLAVGINIYLVDGTQIGQQLKASVLNSNNQEILSDLYIDHKDWVISIKSSKNIQEATSISFSINYNPTNINIAHINQGNGSVTELSNTPGIATYIITFPEPQNFTGKQSILDIDVEKNNASMEHINLIQANFIDLSKNTFDLSTSWIDF